MSISMSNEPETSTAGSSVLPTLPPLLTAADVARLLDAHTTTTLLPAVARIIADAQPQFETLATGEIAHLAAHATPEERPYIRVGVAALGGLIIVAAYLLAATGNHFAVASLEGALAFGGVLIALAAKLA